MAALAGGMLWAVPNADASEGHVDALVYQEGGRVRLGGIDVDCFSGVSSDPECNPNGTNDRVYEGEILEPSPGFYESDEPGFFSVSDANLGALPSGDNLPPGAAHTLDLLLAPNSPVPGASILFWDGMGAVAWSAVPNGEFFEIEGNGGSGGILDGTNYLLGTDLDAPDVDGAFDTHPEYLLNGNGVDDPTSGFYAIFGRTSIDGLDISHTWGAVLDFRAEDILGGEEMAEEAHEMAVASVASFIPEPGTGTLVLFGLLGLSISGRRRKAA